MQNRPIIRQRTRDTLGGERLDERTYAVEILCDMSAREQLVTEQAAYREAGSPVSGERGEQGDGCQVVGGDGGLQPSRPVADRAVHHSLEQRGRHALPSVGG